MFRTGSIKCCWRSINLEREKSDILRKIFLLLEFEIQLLKIFHLIFFITFFQDYSSQDNANGDSGFLVPSRSMRRLTEPESFESLRKRYEEILSAHSAAVSKLEQAQDDVSRLKKECDELSQDRNNAVRERNGLKQKCTAAMRQWDIALHERNEYRDALGAAQAQREEAVQELSQAMAVRMKASKDIKRLTDERNSAIQEYALIMSERYVPIR